MERHGALPLVVVLCLLGVGISLLGFDSVSQHHKSRVEAEFQRDLDRRVAHVEQHLSRVVEQLRSIGALIYG